MDRRDRRLNLVEIKGESAWEVGKLRERARTRRTVNHTAAAATQRLLAFTVTAPARLGPGPVAPDGKPSERIT